MNKVVRRSYLSLVYLFLYTPIVIVVIFSFNNAIYSLLWHGFTLHWYRVLFQDQTIGTVTLHSLEIGLLASTIATLLGLIGAVSLYRYRFFGKRALNILILGIIIVPDIVLGIALLVLFSQTHFKLGFFSLLIAHITFCIPFACVTISSRVIDLDKNLIEAGKDLGANEFTLYRRILIPLLLPGIIAAWLLSFTLSLDDVIISYFVSGPNFQILPLEIFSMVKVGVKPELNALCSIILLVTFSIAIASQFLLRRKQ